MAYIAKVELGRFHWPTATASRIVAAGIAATVRPASHVFAAIGPTARCRPSRRGTYIVTAYTVMAYIGMAYIVMAYIVMAYMVMAYVLMAYIVMAYIVMAHIVTAHVVTAHI